MKDGVFTTGDVVSCVDAIHNGLIDWIEYDLHPEIKRINCLYTFLVFLFK